MVIRSNSIFFVQVAFETSKLDILKIHQHVELNTQYTPYLHNLKLPLYFVVVRIPLKRLLQLFYLPRLIDMMSDSESRKLGGHTWLDASLACSSATLRALVSVTVTKDLCALRDCDRRSTSDSRDVTCDSRSLTLGRRRVENTSGS